MRSHHGVRAEPAMRADQRPAVRGQVHSYVDGAPGACSERRVGDRRAVVCDRESAHALTRRAGGTDHLHCDETGLAHLVRLCRRKRPRKRRLGCRERAIRAGARAGRIRGDDPLPTLAT